MTRLGCLLLVLLLAACASNPEPRAPLSLSATAMRAETYLKQGQLLDALPLYEELSAREPKNPLYAERLAFCLIARSETTPTGPERTALVARARSEAERAKKLGNNSNILGTILERTNNPAAVVNRYDESLQAAEEMFVKGDMDGALAAYEKIAASDPKSYAARVYAGDVYYRKQDFRKAAEWFQKAIDVDPNYETAYRYWGDSLMAAGDSAAALQKFVDAVIAEPYNGNSWRGLSQWAERNAASVSPPRITLPKAPSDGGKTINVDAGMLKDPASGAAWLVYSATRSIWQTEEFKKHFPAEKQYRHSLPEEVAAMQTALATLDGNEPKDANLRALAELQKDGMLEAYILLTAYDDGLARDYDAYRNANRVVLHNYMLKHVVKRNASGR